MRVRTRYYSWRNIQTNVALYYSWHFAYNHVKTGNGRTIWLRLGPLWLGIFITAKIKVKK